MKRLFIVIFAVMLAFALLTIGQNTTLKAQAGKSNAKIQFESTTVEFGEKESGEIATVQFKFKNVGKDVLVIKNISSSCGCTVPQLDKKEYQPGESGVLPVQFNTRGYNGKVVKTITVNSNDSENGMIQLNIAGTVNMKDFAVMELDSDKLDFGDLVKGKKYSKKVTIRNTGTIELKIIEVTHGADMYPIFPKKELKAHEEMNMEIVFTPMDPGKINNFLKIMTNAYQSRMMIVKITADVK